jgi:hypothetical protein
MFTSLNHSRINEVSSIWPTVCAILLGAAAAALLWTLFYDLV